LLQTSVAAGASGPLIVLSGVADISTITQLSGVITSQLSEITRQLIIDASGLRFADSAAIALLLLVARTLKGQGGTMVLIRPQPAVARAVTLADPGQIIMIQGRTSRTPKSEGGGGGLELGPRCRDLPSIPGSAGAAWTARSPGHGGMAQVHRLPEGRRVHPHQPHQPAGGVGLVAEAAQEPNRAHSRTQARAADRSYPAGPGEPAVLQPDDLAVQVELDLPRLTGRTLLGQGMPVSI